MWAPPHRAWGLHPGLCLHPGLPVPSQRAHGPASAGRRLGARGLRPTARGRRDCPCHGPRALTSYMCSLCRMSTARDATRVYTQPTVKRRRNTGKASWSLWTAGQHMGGRPRTPQAPPAGDTTTPSAVRMGEFPPRRAGTRHPRAAGQRGGTRTAGHGLGSGPPHRITWLQPRPSGPQSPGQ